MWVLVASINDYRQHGEYFMAAFDTKPTVEELRRAVDSEVSAAGVLDLLDGKPAIDAPESSQGHWFRYRLVEIKHGVLHKHDNT